MRRGGDAALGERLKRHRLRRAVTQQWLGMPYLTGAHVSALENGTRGASPDAIRYLAAKLELGTEELENPVPVEVVDELEQRDLDALRALSAGRLDGAESSFEALLEDARAAGVPRLAGSALAGLARTYVRRGQLEAARRCADESIRAVATAPPTTWVGPVSTRAWIQRLDGEIESALTTLQTLAARLATERVAVPGALAPALGRLAVTYVDLERRVEAMRTVADVKAMDLTGVRPFGAACLDLNVAWVLHSCGDRAEARRRFRRAEHAFARLRFPREAAAARSGLGNVMADEGDWVRARACWARSLREFGAARAVQDEVETGVNLATAEEALGNESRARQILRDTLSKARRESPRSIWVARAYEILVRTSPPGHEEALPHADHALSIYRDHGNAAATARVLRAKGSILGSAGRRDEAAACYAEALALLVD